jgi:hypothetical protein
MTSTQLKKAIEPRMVTIFGDGEEIDHALAAAFVKKGSRTHIVTIATGWLESSDVVVARLDTPAGADALRDLEFHNTDSSRIICICKDPGSVEEASDLVSACSRSGSRHEVTLLWHPTVSPHQADPQSAVDASGGEVSATRLADLVAREMSVFAGVGFDQHSVSFTPS